MHRGPKIKGNDCLEQRGPNIQLAELYLKGARGNPYFLFQSKDILVILLKEKGYYGKSECGEKPI